MTQPCASPIDHRPPETNSMQSNCLTEQNMNTADPLVDGRRREDATARIRALNDAFRRTSVGGRMLMTAGLAALPRDEQRAIIAAVMAFDSFDPGDDPYGEHDFGSLRIGVHHVMWKIDYYDRSERVHSPDPSDPAVTCRVLTIVLAEEY